MVGLNLVRRKMPATIVAGESFLVAGGAKQGPTQKKLIEALLVLPREMRGVLGQWCHFAAGTTAGRAGLLQDWRKVVVYAS